VLETADAAIGTVEIDRRWRVGPLPGPIVTRVDPEAAGLGAAATGAEYGNRRVVGEQRLRSEDMFGEPRL
jgi:hypothetical protein